VSGWSWFRDMDGAVQVEGWKGVGQCMHMTELVLCISQRTPQGSGKKVVRSQLHLNSRPLPLNSPPTRLRREQNGELSAGMRWYLTDVPSSTHSQVPLVTTS
jgi:hypothetical protein